MSLLPEQAREQFFRSRCHQQESLGCRVLPGPSILHPCEHKTENFEGDFTELRQEFLEVASPQSTQASRARNSARHRGGPLHRTQLPIGWGVRYIFVAPSPLLRSLSTAKAVALPFEPRLRNPSLCARRNLPEVRTLAKILVHYSSNLLISLSFSLSPTAPSPPLFLLGPDPSGGCSIERAPVVQVFFALTHEALQRSAGLSRKSRACLEHLVFEPNQLPRQALRGHRKESA